MTVHSEQRARTIKIKKGPLKKPLERLNWPRFAEDDPSTPLGVDVQLKRPDIIKIVHKHFRVPDISMEELLQEVYLAIIHKNCTRSAHDPRKSSFGHYVYMVANNVCINLAHRKRRYDKEKDSIDMPYGIDDNRTLLEVTESKPLIPEVSEFDSHLEGTENVIRGMGMLDAARYIRAARSGASPEVIREALTWGNRNITNKSIRDIRNKVREAIQQIRDDI